MKTGMRMVAVAVMAILLGLTVVAGGDAAGFPEKPITLVVHAGAGGGSDIFSRTMAAANDKEKYLPQPIVVENKPGGSGAISFAYVAGKKGDPYFMLTAVTSFLTTPILRKSQIGYKDFTPLANFAFDEYMLMVKGDSKYKTVKDVIAFAKANPKKMTVGGTQLGSSDSVCSYLIEKAAGVQLNYIVFNSGGEVNAALMGGHIDLAVSNPGEALELAKANKVRLLGVYSEKRLAGRAGRAHAEGAGAGCHLRPEPRLGGARRDSRGRAQDHRGRVPEVHEERDVQEIRGREHALGGLDGRSDLRQVAGQGARAVLRTPERDGSVKVGNRLFGRRRAALRRRPPATWDRTSKPTGMRVCVGRTRSPE